MTKQHEPNQKLGVILGAPEWKADPATCDSRRVAHLALNGVVSF